MTEDNRYKPAPDLGGKLAVVTGATGGLGSAICRSILSSGGSILMINRNRQKSEALTAELKAQFPAAQISFLLCDLEDIRQVKEVSSELASLPVDILMLNAGTYAIPKARSSSGYDTVFQTNFLSHYYLVKQLLPVLQKRKTRIVATGSIAHRFNQADFSDPDFFRRKGANEIYGNSKRFLMFALMELAREQHLDFVIGHPGISFTGITSHYPKNLLKIVRFSMQLLFMPPRKACLSMVRGIYEDVPYLHWIGPRYFDIWGPPRIKKLDTCSRQERIQIYAAAEEMCRTL